MNHSTKTSLKPILALLVGLILTAGCAGGGGGPAPRPWTDPIDSEDPTSDAKVLEIEPPVLLSEDPGSSSLRGTDLPSATGGVTVRFVALDGTTPFAGGTSDALVMEGTVQSDGSVLALFRRAGLRRSIHAHVEVRVPGGELLRSPTEILELRAPELHDASPRDLDADLRAARVELRGANLGPRGAAGTLRLDAESGRPFFGGQAESIELEGHLLAADRADVLIPDLGLQADANLRATLHYPSGAQTQEISLVARAPERLAKAGASVALDGPRAVVGAPDASDGRGTAYVYQKGAKGWAYCGELFLLDLRPGDDFGTAVAIEDERIVVGVPGRYQDAGVAYVFELREVPGPGFAKMRWTAVATIVPPAAQRGARFGEALSFDGAFLAVGAPQTDLGSLDAAGAAYLYRRGSALSDGQWLHTASLFAGDAVAGARLGSAVAVNDHSEGLVQRATIVVGAPRHTSYYGGVYRERGGCAYVYEYLGASSSPNLGATAIILPADVRSDDRLGAAVALQRAGNTLRLVVGAPRQDARGPDSGAAYVFELDAIDGAWRQQAKLLGAVNRAGDRFGASVASRGNVVLVGAPEARSGLRARAARPRSRQQGMPGHTRRVTTTPRLRDDALAIWRAGVDAVRPERLVPKHLRVEEGTLGIGSLALRLDAIRRIVVVGGGKAGAGMARAVEAVFGEAVLARKQVEGIVSVPADCIRPTRAVTLVAARPPCVNEPTPEGVAATRRILDLVGGLDEDDVAIVLLSGGGSALLSVPRPGLDLADKIALTRELTARGVAIGELNAVRRELSVVKGGGLARACRAGRCVALILSDVMGDDLATIASGPTVASAPDPDRAARILADFGLATTPAGARAIQVMRAGRHEPIADARPSSNVLIGNNATAVDAAAEAAATLGYEVVEDDEPDGTVEETAARLVDRLRSLRGRRPCLISGGEPTVRLAAPAERGLGGRNQQLALAALLRLGDCRGVVLLSGGSDGEDGPTDAAGAVACEAVARAAAARGLDARDHLRRNDAYPFFEQAGGLIRTGPTHTNVCDLRVGLAGG